MCKRLVVVLFFLLIVSFFEHSKIFVMFGILRIVIGYFVISQSSKFSNIFSNVLIFDFHKLRFSYQKLTNCVGSHLHGRICKAWIIFDMTDRLQILVV